MDDLGWRDLGPYGNRFIDTPNIDRFAAESVRFTNAYAACCVCSPTRASIMTGKYPARLHLTDWIPGRKQWPTAKLLTPQFNQFLPMADKTIAETIAPHGYRTAAMGKWHLGGDNHLPTDRGFGTNIAGTAAGQPPTYFGPLELPGLSLAPGEFLTERLTTEGIRFMTADQSSPFFLYQAHFTVHLPLEARAEVIAKYQKRDTGDVNPTYCAMVESADDSMGRLMKALEDSGRADNTIVFDQGGRPSGAVRLGEWKLIEFYEDGRLELFHLGDDPGERRNVARREAGRAKKLRSLLADWRHSTGASMPTPNPQYDPVRSGEGLTGYEPSTPPL
jgi:arylsulfatase A-like enzyme